MGFEQTVEALGFGARQLKNSSLHRLIESMRGADFFL